MKIIRHKISAILLIMCLLVPAISTYSWMQIRLYHLKKEVKAQIIAGINTDQLVQIRLTHAEAALQLEWEHGKEFEYKGQMYDLVKAQITADSVFYWCWWDQEETKLNIQLKEMTAEYFGRDPVLNENRCRLVAFYSQLYIVYIHHWNDGQAKPGIISCNYTIKKENCFNIPPVPPPRLS